ncbi:MAG: BamA/TamA family outer membrane protein [Rhodospirillales bacterium]|nr:BamA/TamA family outer membrane protein [Rhodospirillales bacterium]
MPANVRASLGLAPGQPGRAADVLAARIRLLAALQGEGYALATVSEPLAILHPGTRTLDITFRVAAGPRVDLGPIRFAGLKTIRAPFLRRHITLHPGEQFTPAALDAARRSLAALPIVSSVTVQLATTTDAQGRLPVTFALAERRAHVVTLSADYSTDLGVGLTAAWEDRNLFGNAEDLRIAAGTHFGGTATDGLGGSLDAIFTKPDFLARDQSLTLSLATLDRNLVPYDQIAVIARAGLSRPLTPHLIGAVAIAAEQEAITQDGTVRDATLVGVPLSVAYDSTDSPFAPTRGFRASAIVTPTDVFTPPTRQFIIAEASGSTYLDLSRFAGERPGRSVLALRGYIGSIVGASLDSIPADKRFYGGGSGTIRGYKYLSIGPTFADGTIEGGASIDAGTIELRQRVWGKIGIASFVDFGQVAAGSAPFAASLRVGAGFGLRYFTSFGPLRVDIAVPLRRLPGGDAFELYIGLGEAF